MISKIDEIKQQIRIKDVVQHYLTINKKGKNYWAICPFHSDTKPSLSISEEKNLFKCFSCGCSGDGVFFVMKKENISFSDAIVKIGQLLNIEVGTFKKNSYKNDQLFQINEVAYKTYIKLLWENKQAMEWLVSERKLTEDLISFFNIGYSENDNSLEEMYLRWNELNTQSKISFFDIEKLGLLKQNYQKTYINFFQNRVMFPIFNMNNKVEGFSGRTINKNEDIKYLNSQESLIFKKSESLYNIQNLQKDQPVYVYEGFFDLISAYRIGFTNGVAIMGSSLSTKNIEIISGFHKKIILCFDKDLAGIKNTIDSAKKSFLLKLQIYVVFLTKHKDIDSLINENEKEAKKALENPMLFFDWYPKSLKEENEQIQKTKIPEMVNFFMSWVFNLKTKKFLGNTDIESAKQLVDFAFELFNLLDDQTTEQDPTENKKLQQDQKQQYLKILDNFETTDKSIDTPATNIEISNNYQKNSHPKPTDTIDNYQKTDNHQKNNTNNHQQNNNYQKSKTRNPNQKYINLAAAWIKHKEEIKELFPDNSWFFGWKILQYAPDNIKDILEIIKKVIDVEQDSDCIDEISKYGELPNNDTNVRDFFSLYFSFIHNILTSYEINNKNQNIQETLESKDMLSKIRQMNEKRSKEIFEKLQLFQKND